MIFARQKGPYICLSCLRRQLHSYPEVPQHARSFTKSGILPQQDWSTYKDTATQGQEKSNESDVGQMSKRLAQLTEDFIEQDGRSAQKAVQNAAFPEELKRKLEERIRDNTFKSENAIAYAQVNMPV